MVTTPDLLAHIRARLDKLIEAHTRALVAGDAAKHDRTAGKIEALESFKKDLSQVSRDFQSLDEPLEDRPQYRSIAVAKEQPVLSGRVRR
jgi:hypothetical protein